MRRCSATRRSRVAPGSTGRRRRTPAQAIDEVEHDLSTLRELIGHPDRPAVRGHAHYLLGLNDSLRRSVVRRWARAQSRWRAQDGLVVLSDAIRPMLATQRLGARPYSVSALQKFTLCPYQFALSAIYRLQPNQEPEPLQRLDPLTKGSIFHEVQAVFFRAMRDAESCPSTPRVSTDALGRARTGARHGRREVRREPGAGHPPRLVRRDRRDRPGPSGLGEKAARGRRVDAEPLRATASGCPTRGATSAASPSLSRSMAGSCFAARST